MTEPIHPGAAGEERLRLLKDLLRSSEELYSQAGNPEQAASLLENRETLIQNLQKLDSQIHQHYSKEQMAPFQQEAEALIQLIQKLDQQTRDLMLAEKEEILTSIRSNTSQQKLAGYTQSAPPSTGSRLDYKK